MHSLNTLPTFTENKCYINKLWVDIEVFKVEKCKKLVFASCKPVSVIQADYKYSLLEKYLSNTTQHHTAEWRSLKNITCSPTMYIVFRKVGKSLVKDKEKSRVSPCISRSQALKEILKIIPVSVFATSFFYHGWGMNYLLGISSCNDILNQGNLYLNYTNRNSFILWSGQNSYKTLYCIQRRQLEASAASVLCSPYISNHSSK